MRELADNDCSFLLSDLWVFLFDRLMKRSRKVSDGKKLTFVYFCKFSIKVFLDCPFGSLLLSVLILISLLC